MVSRGTENDQFFQIPLILEVKIGGDHSNSSAVCGTGKKKKKRKLQLSNMASIRHWRYGESYSPLIQDVN